MCDYSLHHVSSRPAKVADRVFTTEFEKSGTRGFAAVGEHGAKLVVHEGPPKVAVCLLPGTELAFDKDVRYERAFSLLGKARANHKLARFRQIDMDDPHVQHDALEFPDGQVVKVALLVAGQTATVLQLPVATQHPEHVETRSVARSPDARVALNRGSLQPGMASILVPSLETVMLWHAFRSAAAGLSAALVQSFRRLAPKRRPIQNVALPAGLDAERIEAGFTKDVLLVTLPKKSGAHKPAKKIEINAAA